MQNHFGSVNSNHFIKWFNLLRESEWWSSIYSQTLPQRANSLHFSLLESRYFCSILFTNILSQFSLNIRKMKPAFISKTVNRYKAFKTTFSFTKFQLSIVEILFRLHIDLFLFTQSLGDQDFPPKPLAGLSITTALYHLMITSSSHFYFIKILRTVDFTAT